MKTTTNATIATANTAAITEILEHDRYIGSVLDTAAEIKSLSDKTVERTHSALKGLQNKQDYRMVSSAQRDEQKWTVGSTLFFAESRQLNIEEQRITERIENLKKEFAEIKKIRSYLVSKALYTSCTSFFALSGKMKLLRSQIVIEMVNLDEARDWKPSATIKKSISGKKLHSSYVETSKRNEKMIKEYIYRLKLEDIDPWIKPILAKDKDSFIKIEGFRYEKPYLIIAAQNAEDEFVRTHYTRTSDETTTVFYRFKVSYNKNGKPHPDLYRLRNFLENVGIKTKSRTLSDMCSELVGNTYKVSNNAMVPVLDNFKKPVYVTEKDLVGRNVKVVKMDYNPEFLGYSFYDDASEDDVFLRSYKSIDSAMYR